jgi:hypothetical protein
VNHPTIEDLTQWLEEPLANALGHRYDKRQILPLASTDSVADSTTKALVRDSSGRSLAVVLCSAPASPDMVQRAMYRAHKAKVSLGPTLGEKILDPMAEGRVQGLSYAIIPHCERLSDFGPYWVIQRAILAPTMFDWLRRVTEHTVHKVESGAIGRRYDMPLRHIASISVLSDRVHAAAERTMQRLDSGAWIPQHVLMHGDLWKGNLLVRERDAEIKRRRWQDRVVVIDWAGSETHGYAIYDLIRLAQSMQMSRVRLRNEIKRHCDVLQCDPTDATSHLVAALGHIAMNLEHFPIDRYARMAESCTATLEGIAA